MENPLSYTKSLIGIATFSGLTLMTLLTKDTDQIDIALKIGAIALAIAIPAQIAHIITLSEENIKKSEAVENAYKLIDTLSAAIGYIAALVAVSSIFWHFSVIAGIFFVITSIVWIVMLLNVEKIAKKINVRLK
ncbi:MAG: hypothetical protein ACXW03_09810 [Methylobacter sp.]